jgi:hypothetical protein
VFSSSLPLRTRVLVPSFVNPSAFSTENPVRGVVHHAGACAGMPAQGGVSLWALGLARSSATGASPARVERVSQLTAATHHRPHHEKRQAEAQIGHADELCGGIGRWSALLVTD